MIASGINFALHFVAWRAKSLRYFWQDPECRFYLAVITLGMALTSAFLFYSGTYKAGESLLQGSFTLVSILTTSGYTASDFSAWPSFLPYFLFFTAFMGGCAGSTAGGMKMIRVLLVFKQGMREIHRLVHPNAILQVKLGTSSVSDRIVWAVWAFFIAYALAFLLICILLLATGLDFTTAFSAAGACLTNLGPGLGAVSAHYGDLSAAAKWLLCVAMIMGRLEVFTLLVLFSPAFWRA